MGHQRRPSPSTNVTGPPFTRRCAHSEGPHPAALVHPGTHPRRGHRGAGIGKTVPRSGCPRPHSTRPGHPHRDLPGQPVGGHPRHPPGHRHRPRPAARFLPWSRRLPTRWPPSRPNAGRTLAACWRYSDGERIGCALVERVSNQPPAHGIGPVADLPGCSLARRRHAPTVHRPIPGGRPCVSGETSVSPSAHANVVATPMQ
jgi:hypothetical protein